MHRQQINRSKPRFAEVPFYQSGVTLLFGENAAKESAIAV
jgi:hypothetical protein